jgi:hypothetical protein
MEEVVREELQENEALVISEEVQQALASIDYIQFEIEKIANSRVLFGKTSSQWLEYFRIEIHTQPDPLQIQGYCAMLNERLNVAYTNKSKTQHALATYMASYEEQLNKEISKMAFNKSRKVMPAADTLEKVAHSQMGNRKIMLDQYKIYIDFWQNIIYKLKDTLELVKIAGMSNGTLYKAERGSY